MHIPDHGSSYPASAERALTILQQTEVQESLFGMARRTYYSADRASTFCHTAVSAEKLALGHIEYRPVIVHLNRALGFCA